MGNGGGKDTGGKSRQVKGTVAVSCAYLSWVWCVTGGFMAGLEASGTSV